MNFSESHFEIQVRHSAELAMSPGWWAYAQQQVIAMEKDESGQWAGLRSEVGKLVKAAGFKPRADEIGTWWDIKSEAQLEAEKAAAKAAEAKQKRKSR